MFLKHDLDFSGRAIIDAMRATNHDQVSMVFLPICPKWRNLRKIATTHLFISQRLDASEALRLQKINELVEYAGQCSESGLPIDIGKAAFVTTLNLLSNTIFSMDLATHVSSNSQEFKDIIWTLLEEAARPNVSDFFPLVRGLDLQGVLRRATDFANKLLGIFEEIIDERLRNSNDAKDDFLGTLLKLVDNNELSLDEVKHLLVDLFTAGTDTSSSTLEWAITELLRNPKKMEKAQTELDQVFGKHGFIQESDISKLPYIQAIVKETYRLHPPAPFLIPYKAEKVVELGKFSVPKNAHVWVNVWSIGRNPSVWTNPLMFSPERFLDKELMMVHLMLAKLLHAFNWTYHGTESYKDINVEEKFGISLQKAQPLQAIALPR
uniref:Cytochrome P450 76AD1-like protein n=1 Tax=Chenopodium quinoa TaxID=63459 RepID=A0A803KYZ1_CHEQI